LTQERRLQVTRPPTLVTTTLNLPGTGVLPLPAWPADWTAPQRLYRLELRDGDRPVWQQSQLPRNARVTVRNRPWNLNALAVGDQVRVDLTEVQGAGSPLAN
jgi:hypothetical protein